MYLSLRVGFYGERAESKAFCQAKKRQKIPRSKRLGSIMRSDLDSTNQTHIMSSAIHKGSFHSAMFCFRDRFNLHSSENIRVADFNNFQQSSTRIKITRIFYHFQILLTIPLHHILVFFFSLFSIYNLFSCLHMKNIHSNDVQTIK